MTLRESYRLSLKMPEAEEVLDLLFYRPLAFLLVRVIYRAPVTPNQISILSMMCGLVTASELAVGTPPALTSAAIWYLAANILDCSDGQLARLQNSGTPLGRVVDGVADYVSSTAIFLGIGFGYAGSIGPGWYLVVAAGVSAALQSGMFDNVQSEFIAAARGEGGFLEKEKEKIGAQLRRTGTESGGIFRRLLIGAYLAYLNVQSKFSRRKSPPGIAPELYRAGNRRRIRLWSFLGPTTNRTLLIVLALCGRIDLYLWIVLIPANLWLTFCLGMDRRLTAGHNPGIDRAAGES